MLDGLKTNIEMGGEDISVRITWIEVWNISVDIEGGSPAATPWNIWVITLFPLTLPPGPCSSTSGEESFRRLLRGLFWFSNILEIKLLLYF